VRRNKSKLNTIVWVIIFLCKRKLSPQTAFITNFNVEYKQRHKTQVIKGADKVEPSCFAILSIAVYFWQLYNRLRYSLNPQQAGLSAFLYLSLRN